MNLGYEINLEAVCRKERFKPEEVVQSDLVFPKGAVPNAQIIWVRVLLKNGERRFVTLPLRDFYEFVDLPVSSIGGWTDGEVGTDESGMKAHLDRYGSDGSDIPRLDTRYEIDHIGSDVALPDELQHSSESDASPVD
jgi:hypothetical protein